MKTLLLLSILSLCSFAKLSFINPHIAHVIPGSKISAAFLIIKNDSDKAVDLVGVKSDFAKVIELHTHEMEEGVMAMRKVEKMTIPAHGELVLKSKSLHIMIFKIQEELKLDSKRKMELSFSDGTKENVDFKIIDVYAKGYKHP